MEQAAGAQIEGIRQNETGTGFSFAVDAPSSCFVASSQPFTPGWEVRINGLPVAINRVNEAFIGFRVPAGRSAVVVQYRPATFFWISGLASLLAVYVWIAPDGSPRPGPLASRRIADEIEVRGCHLVIAQIVEHRHPAAIGQLQ